MSIKAQRTEEQKADRQVITKPPVLEKAKQQLFYLAKTCLPYPSHKGLGTRSEERLRV